MRVLNIMMGRGRGGLEMAALHAHNALSLAGCDVVTVLNSKSQMRRQFGTLSRVITIGSLFARDPIASLQLKWHLRKLKYDVILAHGNRAVYLAHSLKRYAPIILDCHTTNYSARKVIDKIDGAIVLTQHYRSIMESAGLHADRIQVVPNGIDIGDDPITQADRERPIIGGLGRLVPNKGFDILLHALAKLKLDGVPFQAVIHGAEEDNTVTNYTALRDKLGLTSEDVAFPGWTNNPIPFMRSIDIFCMPSRREVLSLALLEALACGKPIVCTKVPGLEDVFEDKKEGYFVDIENIPQLIFALKKLLTNPQLRKIMSEAARSRSKRFAVSLTGQELRSALEILKMRALEKSNTPTSPN